MSFLQFFSFIEQMAEMERELKSQECEYPDRWASVGVRQWDGKGMFFLAPAVFSRLMLLVRHGPKPTHRNSRTI